MDTPEPSCKVAGCWGDPHYFSFDLVAFAFQADGDFVDGDFVTATKAANPDFEIQMRQCLAFHGSPVSTARAVGACIQGDVVEFHADGTLYLNGSQTPVPPLGGALPLPGGGSVYPSASGRTVLAWPTGERLVLQPSSWVHGSYMNVLLLAPPSSSGNMRGIFGNADNDPSNEFMMARDDSELSSGLTFLEMYEGTNSYANVWWVGTASGDVALIQHGTPCADPDAPGQPVWLNNLDRRSGWRYLVHRDLLQYLQHPELSAGREHGRVGSARGEHPRLSGRRLRVPHQAGLRALRVRRRARPVRDGADRLQ